MQLTPAKKSACWKSSRIPYLAQVRDPADFPIEELIPQRSPIICVDQLRSCSEQTAVTRFTIPSDFIFQQGQRITPSGLLEHIAQSAAARAGYIARSAQSEPKLGFIASFKKVKVNYLPELGEILETTLTFVSEALQLSMFDAQVYCANELVATCRINVIVQS